MSTEHARTALRIARQWLARIEAIAPGDTNAQRHAAMDRFAVRDRLSVIASGMPDRVFGDAIAAVHDSIGWLNHEQRTPEEWRRGVGMIADDVSILGDLIGDDEPPATLGPAGNDADTEPQPPALKPRERDALLAMAQHGPESLLSVEAIALEAHASEATAGRGLAGLIEHGLAERPEGEREGARLTNRGRRLARKIDC